MWAGSSEPQFPHCHALDIKCSFKSHVLKAGGTILGDSGSLRSRPDWRLMSLWWLQLAAGPSWFTCFLSVVKWVASAKISVSKDYGLRPLK